MLAAQPEGKTWQISPKNSYMPHSARKYPAHGVEIQQGFAT
jgi:hypothetical protein